MLRIHPARLILILGLAILFQLDSFASIDSCVQDLFSLENAMRKAIDVTKLALSEADRLEQCRRDPSINDEFQDRCSSKESSFNLVKTRLFKTLDLIDSYSLAARLSCSAKPYSGIDVSDSCKSALQKLDDSLVSAVSATNETAIKLSNLTKCRKSPDLYDSLGDQCRSKLNSYHETKNDIFKFKLNIVNDSAKTVRLSCGTGPRSEAAQFCAMLIASRKQYPIEVIRESCKKFMSDDQCMKCLSNK